MTRRLGSSICVTTAYASWPAGFFQELCLEVLKYLAIDLPVVVDVTLVTEHQMAELNYRFRGAEGSTDVLSFALEEGEPVAPHGDGHRYLGEIFISPRVIRRQARSLGHTAREEMAFIFVHGCLHLLGYDHPTTAKLERMNLLTKSILKSRTDDYSHR